jgi:peptidyl-prolyl cis-trans isomerase SurA
MLPSRRLPITLALVALIAAGACRRSAPEARPLTPDVWAVVDGRDIHRSEVEAAYRATVDPSQAPSGEEALAAKLNILDQMITQDVLLARAKALSLDATDDEVQKAVAERKGSGTDAQFELQLTTRGMTLDEFRNGIRRELIVQKLVDHEINSKVAVSDEEVTAYYNANKAEFNVPETAYRLAQIVVTPVRDAQVRNRKGDDATTPAEAKQKMDMLLARLRAGDEFDALAMDYSEDPNTVGQGGDLGFVPVSALNRAPAELKRVVLGTSPGSISVVTINGAPTILLVVAKQDAGQHDLNSPGLRDSIKENLKNRRTQLLRDAYVTSARADAKVVNNLAKQVVDAQGKVPSTVAAPAAK